MNSSYQAYLDMLEELCGHLDQLAQLAQEKAAVVRQDDLLGLDEVLKREQVVGLSLRGLEQRRGKLVKELGLEGTTLRDLPGRCPEELEDRARQTAEKLRGCYTIYRSCADMARNTLELNLHQIEKFVKRLRRGPCRPGRGIRAPRRGAAQEDENRFPRLTAVY